MKLNKYHKEVLQLMIDVFEDCGDDTKMDVEDNPSLTRAYQFFKNACKIKQPKPIKYKESKEKDCEPVARNPVTGVWERINL